MGLIGNPTVLIVDDEELIREVASMMIEDECGTVLVAKSGTEALQVFSANKDKITTVFLDFSMPGMNGYEVYLELMKLNDKLAVVMVSGLKIISEIDKLRREGKIQFLSKPFHQVDLVKALNVAHERI